MQYTTVHRIFSKISRELNREGISETDMVEWIGEALEFIGASVIYEPAIAFIEVKNHQCVMPKHLDAIIQIAVNNGYVVITSDVTEESTSSEDTPDIPVALDSLGQPIHDYELAYYRPYFDLVGEYNIAGLTQKYELQFTPVRLSNHSFFNSIVCKETGFEELYHNCRDEYTIIGNVLRFSFETGQIALSYLRMKVDCDDGYPMIPDEISITTAISSYIKSKIFEQDFYSGRQGAQAMMQKAELDWQWYCAQAKNKSMMPQSIDEWENLLQQRNYLLPRIDRYNQFFGHLSDTEDRRMIRNK